MIKQIFKQLFGANPQNVGKPMDIQGLDPNLIPRLFAVISWGNAATHWLTKILNAHPDVLCLHNIKNPWSQETMTARIDNMVYMKILLRAGIGYKLVGDCHGISRDSIPDLKRLYKDKFRAAIVVRHPIPRIVSYLGIAEKWNYDSYLDNQANFEKAKASVNPQLHKLLDTKERLFFADRVMRNIDIIRNEVQIGPAFTMEKLTKNPEDVNSLLNFLSNGELEFSPKTLETVFSRPIVSHRKPNTPEDPAEIFASWAKWQRELFRGLLHPEAKRLYEELGYDFTFIENN